MSTFQRYAVSLCATFWNWSQFGVTVTTWCIFLHRLCCRRLLFFVIVCTSEHLWCKGNTPESDKLCCVISVKWNHWMVYPVVRREKPCRTTCKQKTHLMLPFALTLAVNKYIKCSKSHSSLCYNYGHVNVSSSSWYWAVTTVDKLFHFSLSWHKYVYVFICNV